MPAKPTFLFLGGPCVIESEKLCFQVAEQLLEASRQVGFEFIFKASYDKANRTSHDSFRGIGMKRGLAILKKIKTALKVRIVTDVHNVVEVKPTAEVADILQIPAFLCRQTDLLVAAAQSGREVNVKKGQFLSPLDVKPILEKLKSAGAKKYFITERGTTFGYNNLVVDMRGLYWMKQLGASVIFDATHAVQRPGGLGKITGGDRELAPVLARAAVAVGVDGLFLEAHPNPDRALSDGPNQVHLRNVPKILEEIALIHNIVRNR